MKIFSAVGTAVLAVGLGFAQQQTTPTPDQVKAEAANTQGVHGVIKSLKAGSKIVVAVENGKDRSYSLADPKARVTVAEDLAIGDKVKVIESGKKGDKSVQIVRDVSNSGQSGERARTSDQQK